MANLIGKIAILAGLSAPAQPAVASALRDAGARVVLARADARTAKGCAALTRAEPRADILVLGTGLRGMQDFFAVSDETWSLFFEANLMSKVRLARAYMPGMAERGWGRIVFLPPTFGRDPALDGIHELAFGEAQLAIMRGLAALGAGNNIAVNAASPSRGDLNELAQLALLLASDGAAAHRGEMVDAAAIARRKTRPPLRLVWAR